MTRLPTREQDFREWVRGKRRATQTISAAWQAVGVHHTNTRKRGVSLAAKEYNGWTEVHVVGTVNGRRISRTFWQYIDGTWPPRIDLEVTPLADQERIDILRWFMNAVR